MPTKGPRRAHEAFTNQPSASYAPETGLDTSENPTPAGRLGGGWTSDAGVNIGLAHHDIAPDYLRAGGSRDDQLEDTDDAGGVETEGAGDELVDAGGIVRTQDRTYRGDQVSVEMRNITAVRESARNSDHLVTPVQVDLGEHQVQGMVRVERGWRGTHDVRFQDAGGAGALSCSCGVAGECEHRQTAQFAVQALVNGSRIRSAVASWERTRAAAGDVLGRSAATSAASQARPPRPASDAPDWADDDNTDPFQTEYEAARARRDAGEALIPYMRENATGGLGARDGGRAFGVEIEFDLDGVSDRRAALAAIGADLHAAGLTSSRIQNGYHSARGQGYRQWSFERDSTVAGEVVSPILFDEPQTWDQLEQVCEIVKRHGGIASARTGSHVHVGCNDYDHTVENHNRLLAMGAEYEDTTYRLAQNPGRRAHRGLTWCSPNRAPSAGYASIATVRSSQGNHQSAMNFQAVTGSATDHVEFRMWDGTLDPAAIQTQVKLSLGMTEAAFRRDTTVGAAEPVGTHRDTNSHLRRGERLAGDSWTADTRSFRRLMDTVFWRESDKRQATALFSGTKWQRRR